MPVQAAWQQATDQPMRVERVQDGRGQRLVPFYLVAVGGDDGSGVGGSISGDVKGYPAAAPSNNPRNL